MVKWKKIKKADPMLKIFSIIFSLIFIVSPIQLTFAQSASSPTVESVAGNSGQLTDQQMYDASRFNHTGYRDTMIQKLCEQREGDDEGKGIKNCDELYQVDSNGFWAAMEQHMGKAYVMIFGGLSFLGGGGMPTTTIGEQSREVKTSEATTKTEYLNDKGEVVDKKDAAKKKETDLCMVMAMGWEMVTMLMQNQLNQNTEQATSHIKNEQLRALVALKKNHEDRANTALAQSVAYGVVSVCYLFYGFAGGYWNDVSMSFKQAAAIFLSVMYGMKHNKHANAADAVQYIIDNLPNDGACNPYTKTDCFCREPSSRELFPNEYQQVCIFNRPLYAPPTSLGCGVKINNEISLDKDCKCRQSNSCFNTQIKAFDPKFKLANNIVNMANHGADLLASGEFNPAKLADFTTTATAFSLKALSSNTKRKPIKIKVAPENMEGASQLAKILPADVAAVIASAPNGKAPVGLGFSGGPSAASLDKLPGDLKKKVAEAIKTSYKTNSSGDSSSSKGSEEPQFQMPTFGKKAEGNNNDVLRFAEKAFNNADITKAKDRIIFEIISNRYRNSGWKKVESPELKAP